MEAREDAVHSQEASWNNRYRLSPDAGPYGERLSLGAYGERLSLGAYQEHVQNSAVMDFRGPDPLAPENVLIPQSHTSNLVCPGLAPPDDWQRPEGTAAPWNTRDAALGLASEAALGFACEQLDSTNS